MAGELRRLLTAILFILFLLGPILKQSELMDESLATLAALRLKQYDINDKTEVSSTNPSGVKSDDTVSSIVTQNKAKRFTSGIKVNQGNVTDLCSVPKVGIRIGNQYIGKKKIVSNYDRRQLSGNFSLNVQTLLTNQNVIVHYMNKSYIPNFQTIPKHLPDENYKERKNIVTHIVIHFASNVTQNVNHPYDINVIYDNFKRYGVSAHYVLDRQGRIFEFVPEDKVAYHAGKGSLRDFPHYKDKLNEYSIAIELMGIGTKDEMLPMISEERYEKIPTEHIGFTESQYDTLNSMLEDLTMRYLGVKRNRIYIIGHEHYAPGRKTDPGSLFDWSKIGL